MANNIKFIIFLLSFSNMAAVESDSSVPCYRIEPGVIAGIACADILLTLVIVMITYRCATHHRHKIEKADEVYMNVRANCKATERQ
ncbi:hematopoietic cell signal transducer [Thalassophryne amazonica]|uniref:hematopoietic cell signal transducer n=1 Tax=Thalassophryne amazonica TaxID=390379 RepID=UPI00147242FB|nr:hematopoietic cell signal transducer [Thalassophryne amazonica]